MDVAIIDPCLITQKIYSKLIQGEADVSVDCFSSPVNLFSSRKNYDLVISEYYFEKFSLEIFWLEFHPNRLIILTGSNLDIELNCLGVFKKNSIHSKNNIVNLVKVIRPSSQLKLVHPAGP